MKNNKTRKILTEVIKKTKEDIKMHEEFTSKIVNRLMELEIALDEINGI